MSRHREGPWFNKTKGTCSRAGVKARAYDFRHTWATEALAAGVPDSHVAAMMGHSTPAILHASYSHLTAKARQLSQTAEELRRKRAG
jgi:integrase